jgi:hypothetical protein
MPYKLLGLLLLVSACGSGVLPYDACVRDQAIEYASEEVLAGGDLRYFVTKTLVVGERSSFGMGTLTALTPTGAGWTAHFEHPRYGGKTAALKTCAPRKQ